MSQTILSAGSPVHRNFLEMGDVVMFCHRRPPSAKWIDGDIVEVDDHREGSWVLLNDCPDMLIFVTNKDVFDAAQ